MGIWHAELLVPYTIDNIHNPVDLAEVEEYIKTHGALTLIAPGTEQNITPESMRRERRHVLFGYTYVARAHDNKDKTGTLHVMAHSIWAQGIVLGQGNRLYALYQSHTFNMGPADNGFREKFFIVHHNLRRQTIIPAALLWQP